MQPSSYGVDSSKGAANISNPYDFKNVQVRYHEFKSIKLFIFLLYLNNHNFI